MRLTHDQHRDIARRAIWYFDCYFGELSQDSVVFTGDGVEDLDRLLSRLEENRCTNFVRRQRYLCDVGTQYAEWRPFDIEDVYAIRCEYIAYYGNVNRPDVYAPGGSASSSSVPVSEAAGGATTGET